MGRQRALVGTAGWTLQTCCIAVVYHPGYGDDEPNTCRRDCAWLDKVIAMHDNGMMGHRGELRPNRARWDDKQQQ